MASMGVIICTAELDQMYSQFKEETKNSTIRVAGIKMAARLAARKQGKCGQEQEDDDASSSDDETANEPRKKGSICNVNITNFNLSHLTRM